ncbi:MAG: coenzyme F420-0:L-glutamate ligase [Candidatus Geothermarchaeales archaeon]
MKALKPMRYRAKTIGTKYWRPGEDYLRIIADSTRRFLRDGDVIVVSEKAISMALGKIVDEGRVKPRPLARVIATIWVRKLWGYVLGPICRLSRENIRRLRTYPKEEGAAHKQVALDHAGLGQALRHFSEGGIDVSNVPGAFACLPLEDAGEIAEEALRAVRRRTKKRVAVMIADSDKTYSFGGLHITPRPRPLRGITYLGLIAYIIGRMFKGRTRSTPLAVAGLNLPVEEALQIAAVANQARGHGAGRTVWDMAEHFGVGLTEVTWEMLEEIEHRPIVIVRRVREWPDLRGVLLEGA